MTIDFNVTDILPQRWWEFNTAVLGDGVFDYDEFVALFKDTFDVLRHCACEDAVDKELIELIKDVSGFVVTRFTKLNYWHLAACELTDAMLTNCLQGDTKSVPITKGNWMLLTSELVVDFTAPEEMLYNFASELEALDEWSG
jgi:hypothetical protein